MAQTPAVAASLLAVAASTINGTLILTNSAVTGNSTSNDNGGGLVNLGTLTMTNSSLVGNIASQAGGGLANGGTATLTNCTLSGNAALSGGGIFSNGTLTLTNTIVATSTSGGMSSKWLAPSRVRTPSLTTRRRVRASVMG